MGIFHGPVTVANRQPPARLFNVPPRSPLFTGRHQELIRLRSALASSPQTVVINALHGTGGVGKTSMAIEFAYRYRDEYDLIWWVPSEQPDLIPTELAGLSAALTLADPEDPVSVAVDRLRTHLGDRDRWLLVFDNAEDPALLSSFLPAGRGHVIITSRNPDWDELAVPVEIGMLPRRDAVILLRRRAGRLESTDAATVAAALDGLPLALIQAGAFIAATGTTADRFLGLLRDSTAAVLDQNRPTTYPSTLAGTTGLTFDHIAGKSTAAAGLLTVLAYLAPEPVPFSLITERPHLLPDDLAAAARDELAFAQACRLLRESGAVRVGPGTLETHRLLATIIRDRVDDGPAWRRRAAGLIRDAVPPDPWDNPSTWPVWHTLLPHVLFVLGDTGSVDDPRNADLSATAGRYLQSRGRAAAAVPLLERVMRHHRDQSGPGSEAALGAACDLATALREAGQLRQALGLGAVTLTLCRTELGADHRLTLQMAGRHTAILWETGQYPAAVTLGDETWKRCRRLLGPADPRTIRSAFILATSLWDLGRYPEALQIGEDTLHQCEQSLGSADPYTLRTTMVVAAVLHDAGQDLRCEAVTRDLLDRMDETLGADHPDRLRTRGVLAAACAGLGRYPEALKLSRSTLSRMRTVLGERHTITMRLSRQHSALLHTVGRTQTAARLARDTYRRSQEALGDDHPDTWSAGIAVGAATLAADPHAAARLLQRIRTRAADQLGDRHPLALRAGHYHLLAVAGTGDLATAVAEGAALIPDLQQQLGSEHPETLRADAAYRMFAARLEPENGQLRAAANAATGALHARGLRQM